MSEKLNVLLVEDEPLITFLFEDILDGTEFCVTATMTCSGPVLRHLDAEIPDVAIVDLILEDGPCTSVIERLMELKVPTVVVSGHSDAEAFTHRDGASFVAKPFHSAKLLAVLRNMVHPRVSGVTDPQTAIHRGARLFVPPA